MKGYGFPISRIPSLQGLLKKMNNEKTSDAKCRELLIKGWNIIKTHLVDNEELMADADIALQNIPNAEDDELNDEVDLFREAIEMLQMEPILTDPPTDEKRYEGGATTSQRLMAQRLDNNFVLPAGLVQFFNTLRHDDNERKVDRGRFPDEYPELYEAMEGGIGALEEWAKRARYKRKNNANLGLGYGLALYARERWFLTPAKFGNTYDVLSEVAKGRRDVLLDADRRDLISAILDAKSEAEVDKIMRDAGAKMKDTWRGIGYVPPAPPPPPPPEAPASLDSVGSMGMSGLDVRRQGEKRRSQEVEGEEEEDDDEDDEEEEEEEAGASAPPPTPPPPPPPPPPPAKKKPKKSKAEEDAEFEALLAGEQEKNAKEREALERALWEKARPLVEADERLEAIRVSLVEKHRKLRADATAFDAELKAINREGSERQDDIHRAMDEIEKRTPTSANGKDLDFRGREADYDEYMALSEAKDANVKAYKEYRAKEARLRGILDKENREIKEQSDSYARERADLDRAKARFKRDNGMFPQDVKRPSGSGKLKGGVVPPKSVLQQMARQAYKEGKDLQNAIGVNRLFYHTPTLKFYMNGNTIIVAIRGSKDSADWTDNNSRIPFNGLRSGSRYMTDANTIRMIRQAYPNYEYYGVAHSLGGALLDLFLEDGIISRGLSYNPAVQTKEFNNTNSKNERIYHAGDPLYNTMGRMLSQKPEVRPDTRQKDNSWTSWLIKKIPYVGTILDYGKTAEDALDAHNLKQFEGGSKAKDPFAVSATRSDPPSKFHNQLKKVGIEPTTYLEEARRRAKKHHYPHKLLGFASDGIHKLAIPDRNGRLVPFGRVSYGDHIIYSHQEEYGKVPKGTADAKQRTFQHSHQRIKGDWRSNPFSPNNLALKILW